MIDRIFFVIVIIYNAYSCFTYYNLKQYDASNTHLLIIICCWLIKFWNDYQHNNKK